MRVSSSIANSQLKIAIPSKVFAMTICQTFRNLSHETWTFLEKARGVGHQPLEETITDNNIIEIKSLHPRDVKTTTFSKRREARTGADWEWWFANNAKSSWFGVRVQAKILKFASNRYEALHYQTQTSVLISDAAKNGLYPLYCFYSQWPLTTAIQPRQCKTFPNAPENYGCALVDAHTISGLKGSSNSDYLASIMALAYPWCCLVCCNGGQVSATGGDLPARVRGFLQGVMQASGAHQRVDIPNAVGQPPSYVIATMQDEDDFADPNDENLAGVMVILGNDG